MGVKSVKKRAIMHNKAVCGFTPKSSTGVIGV